MDMHIPTMMTANSFSSSMESEAYSLQKLKGKENKPIRQKSQSNKVKNSGHWSPTQKELYYIFLTAHRENFLRKELRRTDKIFKQMAKFLKTRAADQCRSHHQKMEKKFNTFDDILESMKDSCTGKDYSELLKTFQSEKTTHTTPYIAPECQPIETEKVLIQSIVEAEFNLEPLDVTYEPVDELELAITSPGLFNDQVFDIDNYFLM